jgi:hypothetical protein
LFGGAQGFFQPLLLGDIVKNPDERFVDGCVSHGLGLEPDREEPAPRAEHPAFGHIAVRAGQAWRALRTNCS